MFKVPRKESRKMGLLPPKKPNIEEKKAKNFIDVNCL